MSEDEEWTPPTEAELKVFFTYNKVCQLYSQLCGLYQCILKHRHAQITAAVSMYIETQTNTEITPGARCKERTER